MTDMLRGRGGIEKEISEFGASRAIGVQVMFIEVILDGTKGNLNDRMLVGGRKLSGCVLLAETRDSEEARGEGNRRGEERFDKEDGRSGGQRRTGG
jgi:hypothetical protein